jgi:hypothetical protein
LDSLQQRKIEGVRLQPCQKNQTMQGASAPEGTMSKPAEILIIAIVAIVAACTIGRLVYQFRFVRNIRKTK